MILQETPPDIAVLNTLVSDVLGDVLMPATARMEFSTPLFGLPDHREYALLPARRAGLWWLQSTSDSSLAFILADPFVLASDYGVDLGDGEREQLGITDADDAFTLVMLTLPTDDDVGATANFRAPLVFNLREQRGLQVVARDEGYGLRTPIDVSMFPAQANGVRMQ